MENEGVWSSSVKPPIWKSENAAGCSVSQSASVDEIFIGWTSVTKTPNSLPTPSWTAESGRTTTIASFAALRKRSTFLPCRRCQQATPSTRKPAVRSPARMMCVQAKNTNPWKRISKMSLASARSVCELSS